MASILMPKAGTAKAWITSAPVVWTRTTLLTGTTISLSTPSRRGLPCPGRQQRVELELAVIGIGVAPVPLLAGRLDGQVGLGHVELEEQQPERRTAMPTRISTGISVQATSIRVLWVVREGTGLALALNLTITMISSASTNSVMTVMMHEQPVVEPVDVVHHRRGRFLQLVFPRRGLPQFGECRPAGRPAPCPPPPIPATAGPSGPSTSSCRSRSLDKVPKAFRRMAGECCTIRPCQRPSKDTLESTAGQIARTRRNPASQTIIPGLSQCSSRAQSHASPANLADVTFSREIRQNPAFCASLRRLTAGLPRCTHRQGAPQEPDSC